MDKIYEYIISKLNDIIYLYPDLEIKFGKSNLFQSYNILIDNSEIYNSEEFMNFEGKMIIEFIKKFNSDYSLFFTDDINMFEVDSIDFVNSNVKEEINSNLFKRIFNKECLYSDVSLYKDFLERKVGSSDEKILNSNAFGQIFIKYESNFHKIESNIFNEILSSNNNCLFNKSFIKDNLLEKYNVDVLNYYYTNKNNVQALFESHSPINDIKTNINETLGNEEYALAA